MNQANSTAKALNDIVAVGEKSFIILSIIVLVIILIRFVFFLKLWGMTNDVAKIKEMMEDVINAEYTRELPNESAREKSEVAPKKPGFWTWNKVPFKKEEK
jgi:signal transduction histidine kinase